MTHLYGRPLGRLACHLFWSRKWFSKIYGWPFHRKLSRRQIDTFVQQHSIHIEEVEMPARGFSTFNDFFIRKLKPGARPIDDAPDSLLSPADSRLTAFPLGRGTILKIKGARPTLPRLLGMSTVPETFAHGLCLQFRLAPSDYHRFGYMVDGLQGPIHLVDGRLYSVSPLALRHLPDIWWRNLRHWCFIQSPTVGTMLQVEVGATVVGSIVQHRWPGGTCRRGGEKGYFQMGGSTVLAVFGPGRVALDEDILHYAAQGIETKVKYGETIGRILSK